MTHPALPVCPPKRKQLRFSIRSGRIFAGKTKNIKSLDKQKKISDWLPTSRKEVAIRGWDGLDVILFSGDAYVDHPSFGTAVIGRVLEAAGLRVAIVPQPNWRDDLRDFKKLGVPRLFFGISSGCMDSMVNHYTANKRLRSDDAYTAGNTAGFRPDYAVTVYSQILKKLYPDTPVIIGGIEASLRRLTHYDYWQDRLKPSILIDSNADMLVYGMGEQAIRLIAQELRSGKKIGGLTDVPQTAYLSPTLPPDKTYIPIHSYEDCMKDGHKFAENFCQIEIQSNKMQPQTVVEPVAGKYVIVNPPLHATAETEVDPSFDLPYTRLPHPRYKDKIIPAFETVKFSVNIHRGCFGGCSFCTISAHQGKFIASRSERSILKEVEKITEMPGFKGYLSDLGGPSANMYGMRGNSIKACSKCERYSCIHPGICKNLNTDPGPLLKLYRKIRHLPAIRKAFIGSGIRYDLFMNLHGFPSPLDAEYFEELLRYHVSGRLKVAPEHTSSEVLRIMRKPEFSLFVKMKEAFDRMNSKYQLRQELVPYFISSHPGCCEQDMRQLSGTMRRMNFNRLEQVQDFTPTPMTLSSVAYYCGFDPYTGQKLYVARGKEEKLRQKQYFFKTVGTTYPRQRMK